MGHGAHSGIFHRAAKSPHVTTTNNDNNNNNNNSDNNNNDNTNNNDNNNNDNDNDSNNDDKNNNITSERRESFAKMTADCCFDVEMRIARSSSQALLSFIGSLFRRWDKDSLSSLQLITLLDLRVSSLRRGHINILCIVPNLKDDPRRESKKNLSPSSGIFKPCCDVLTSDWDNVVPAAVALRSVVVAQRNAFRNMHLCVIGLASVWYTFHYLYVIAWLADFTRKPIGDP